MGKTIRLMYNINQFGYIAISLGSILEKKIIMNKKMTESNNYIIFILSPNKGTNGIDGN